jgi:hypothetical protein
VEDTNTNAANASASTIRLTMGRIAYLPDRLLRV